MSILDLHTELVLDIFDYLDDADVCSARLSHRSLERYSFSHFGRRFFRKKGFMITTPSLDGLQQIASHTELCKYVQHVWINPDCFTFTEAPANGLHAEGVASTVSEGQDGVHAESPIDDILSKQNAEYEKCTEDHYELIHTAKLENILYIALASLPNLRTVGMRRGEAYMPLGCRELAELTGLDPRVLGLIPSGPIDDLSDSTYLFIALIKALSKGSVRLRRFYTDAIEFDDINDDLLHPSAITAACESFLYVELNAVRAWLSTNALTSKLPAIRLQNAYGRGLSRVMQAMPGLKELGLQIFPDRKQSHLLAPDPTNPESWRSSYPYIALQRFADAVSLSRLTRIKLEKITTDASSLQKVLGPAAPCLRSVKIRDIRLLAVYSGEQPWEGIFEFLAEDCLVLDYMLFNNLMYVGDDAAGRSREVVLDFAWGVVSSWEIITASGDKLLEVRGRKEIRLCLRELKRRQYLRADFGAVDDMVWHTDTSDEEW